MKIMKKTSSIFFLVPKHFSDCYCYLYISGDEIKSSAYVACCFVKEQTRVQTSFSSYYGIFVLDNQIMFFFLRKRITCNSFSNIILKL